MSDLAGRTTGERIKHFRTRAGMSRTVLGGLVGRSAEWVKAVETGRLQPPRLPMLLKLARALDVSDLADLTGDGPAVPVAAFAGPAHAALTAVQEALVGCRFEAPTSQVSAAHLQARLDQAWQVRHASPDHRTAVGALLPGLICDAQAAVRSTQGEVRRAARRVLAGVYRLANFYVAYQPAPELVWLVADRSIAEAQEADDPYALAAGAWTLNHALRDTGRWEEAVTVALQGARQLEPWLHRVSDDDWRGLWGALQFEVGYTYARRGWRGEAWQYWDRANEMAAQLGPRYGHVQTSFSTAVLTSHAITLDVELRRPGDAVRTANGFDPGTIPSLPRRSRHLIEVARAYHQRDDRAGTYALLDAAERTAPETIRFNGYARDMLLSLATTPPVGLRDEVHALCTRVGVRP
ncbi:MAG TPA: helix-turn-helix transcriptional regulator [Pseudonocardiaceae bacterium]|jgi:transcriptional regulator with XRE-family HTH domain|nr:helix-turn-helix transcriptional regulator [Pseudonocardiaceae bacterium]